MCRRARHRPAGVREYPADIGEPPRVAGEYDVGDGPRRIGAEFDHDWLLRRHQIDTTIGCGRMRIDQRLAAVEFLHDRQEQGVAEPFVAVARHQGDAVGLQRIERIFDLALGGIDAGRGDGQHRGGDARLVHVRKRLLDGPVLHQGIAKPALVRRGHIGRRREMMMDIDAERFIGPLRRRAATAG